MGGDRRPVERLDAQAEMVHVAALGTGRRAALAAERAGDVDEVDQGPPGAVLPIVGGNSLDDYPPDWSGVTRNTLSGDVSVYLRDGNGSMVGRMWNLQLLIYAYGAF